MVTRTCNVSRYHARVTQALFLKSLKVKKKNGFNGWLFNFLQLFLTADG